MKIYLYCYEFVNGETGDMGCETKAYLYKENAVAKMKDDIKDFRNSNFQKFKYTSPGHFCCRFDKQDEFGSKTYHQFSVKEALLEETEGCYSLYDCFYLEEAKNLVDNIGLDVYKNKDIVDSLREDIENDNYLWEVFNEQIDYIAHQNSLYQKAYENYLASIEGF